MLKSFFYKFFSFFALLFINITQALSACPTVNQAISDIKNSKTNPENDFFSLAFSSIFNKTSEYSETAFNNLAGPCASLLAVFFALWMMFFFLEKYNSGKPINADIITGLIPRVFCLVVGLALLASDPKDIFDLFYIPIVQAGIDFGVIIANIDLMSIDSSVKDVFNDPPGGICSSISSSGASSIGVFPDSLRERMICYIITVNYQLAQVSGFANSLLCKAALESGTLLPNFNLMIIGIIMIAICFLVGFLIPFYFIDGLVRVGIVGALMPALIMFWVFPKTRKYTEVGFRMLLNIAFLFIIVSAVMFLNMVLLGSIFVGNFSSVVSALDANQYHQVEESLNLAGGGIFSLLMLGFFVIKLTTLAPAMSNSLSDTSFKHDSASQLGAIGLVLGYGASSAALRFASRKGAGAKKWYKDRYGKNNNANPPENNVETSNVKKSLPGAAHSNYNPAVKSNPSNGNNNSVTVSSGKK